MNILERIGEKPAANNFLTGEAAMNGTVSKLTTSAAVDGAGLVPVTTEAAGPDDAGGSGFGRLLINWYCQAERATFWAVMESMTVRASHP